MTGTKQHIFPLSITEEVNKALSYFPELQNVQIEVKFKKQIKKSTMQAQPDFGSFLERKKHRKYYILISETFKISNKEFRTIDLPTNVLIGWLGHELGHVIDYLTMNNLSLIWFGMRYLLLENHMIEAERNADTYAVNRGMGDYILETKNFILNHADIDDSYKLRMKKYYLSPEEIMDIVAENNAKS